MKTDNHSNFVRRRELRSFPAGIAGDSWTSLRKERNRSGVVLAGLIGLVVCCVVSAACSGAASGNVPPASGTNGPVAPSINAQPAAQSVVAGHPATFTVAATGSVPLAYQWMRSSVAIGGATASSYTTPATTSADNGAQFSVMVSNSGGSATSKPAMLTVSAAAVAPSITSEPAAQSVVVGQAATFTVVATGTAPMNYQWQRNGTAIPGANVSAYSTPASTSADNGAQFTVVVSNTAGSVTSASALLSVNTPPSITAQPVAQSVVAGQAATFTVAATGTAPLNYQWQKNGSVIAGATASNYTTPATSSADNGAQFAVVVSNAAGSVTSSSAILTVNTPPSITAQPVAQSVTAGQAATFTVATTGTAPLNYQWQKNGAAINGANSATYTTPLTVLADSGEQFRVVVSNTTGNVTSNAVALTVTAAPVAPTISGQPTNQTAVVGQTAAFAVVAAGTLPLTYQWQKNGAAINGANSATYTTPSTASSDNGEQFRVVVSNTAGSVTSNAATLTVNTPPSITTQPVALSVVAGQTATFTVAATGTAPLNYQWQKNGAAIAGAGASTYTTPATASGDNGAQFRVVVSNIAGSVTSNSATLTVTPAFQISTTQLPGATLALPYSTTLAATGGTSPYTWSQLSGQLPNGLALNSNGTISGTPTSGGSFSFLVQVKDAAANTASGTFSITVVSPAPVVAITAPANGATVSGTVVVTGTASDVLNLVSVQVAVDSGSYQAASGTAAWSYSLDTTALSNGPHTLVAQVTDVAAVSATSSPVSFTVSNSGLATDCTLFASASGNDNNPGTSPSAPKTFFGAASATSPGSVVCLLGGTYSMSSTFYPPQSGSPSSWIVYKNYGDGPVNLVWTAGAIAQPMFKLGNDTFPSGAAYLEFRGLNLDGQNNALDGFFCHGGHHVRFIGNSINNTGGSGVGAVQCDYLTSDHNLINHNGYLYGWTSGISYNTDQFYDAYTGFHNIISNNIIVGEYDGSSHHTDGNGIILDLGGTTPPALIINNVVYGNGGRCIQSLSHINFWIVNNTCYKNNLDTSLGNVGSFTSQNSSNGYFINNIVVSWHANNPSYDQEGSNSNIAYYADMYFGSSPNFTPPDPSQLIQADPQFVNPPYFDPSALQQYLTALPPAQLGNGLTLQPTSPAYNRGIDPSTLSGLPANIVSDLKKYIYVDINGKPRPQGGGCDLGAYQH